MLPTKYRRLILILENVLLVVSVATLLATIVFATTQSTPDAWLWLLPSLLTVLVAVALIYRQQQSYGHSKFTRSSRFERSLCRDALLYNCEYAYTVNLTQNRISAVHRLGLLRPYHFYAGGNYNQTIEKTMAQLTPTMLCNDKDLYLSQHYINAYFAGERMLTQEYYLKQSNTYKRKTIFLSKNNKTGDLFAFIALHDITEKIRSKEKTKASLLELSSAAQQIAAGNLNVKIHCTHDEGELGILANSLQNTADQLRIYINSIKDLARRDSMTEMENRTAYAGAIAKIDVRLQQQEEMHFSVIMFDLDDLKQVNDEHGHNEGDKYIIAASELIRTAFPDANCFRIGGDEFAALLFNKNSLDLQRLTQHFEQTLRTYNEVARVKLSVSYGYAVFNPQKDACFADVYARADDEMYRAKRRKKFRTL